MNKNMKLTEDVDSISLKFLDLRGKTREIRIPPDMFDIVKKDGISFDSSNVGFTDVSKSDMVAIPAPETKKIITYENEKTAIYLCGLYWPDGTYFKGDPRFMLKQTIKKLSEKDITIHVKPEYEFYLLNPEDHTPIDTGGYIDGRIGYTRLIGELTKVMKKYNFKIEKVHHEVAKGQYEIEPLPYKDPVKAADEYLFIKEIVKKKALENNAIATFMPKPVTGEAGNGLHIHMSLFKNGKYMFSPKRLNKKASGFIGGLLKHAKALSAISSPTINSYKRLVPGYEAPVYICWGGENRSVLIRIPAYGSSEEEKGRIEYRAGDASANIYLMLNCLIHAGIDGMEKQIDPGEEITENLYQKRQSEIQEKGIEMLPNNLNEALTELSKDEVIKNALDQSYKYYVKLKKQEILNFSREVTQWEKENYLDY